MHLRSATSAISPTISHLKKEITPMKVTKLIVYPPNGAPIEHAASPPDDSIDVVVDTDNGDIKLTVENTTIKYAGLPYQLQYPKSQPATYRSPSVRVGGRARG
jgi:hypothetical protein